MSIVSLATLVAEAAHQIKKDRISRLKIRPSHPVTIAVYSQSGRYPDLTFRINAETAQQARILPGDKVDIRFDPQKFNGHIVRVNSGGITTYTTQIAKEQRQPGKFYAVVARVTWHEGMPWIDKNAPLDNVVAAPDGIVFDLPMGVRFTKYTTPARTR